jgi:DNA polymerase-1
VIFPKAIGFDLETVGVLPEYALQAYRMKDDLAAVRAMAVATTESGQALIDPATRNLQTMLQRCAATGTTIVGWNVAFDASWCLAAGLETEVLAVNWLDAMLLWRHAVVEPEGDDVPTKKRKSYSLEAALKEFFPDQAGFKEFDDFQTRDAAGIERLLERNREDARYTLKLAHLFWGRLTEQQRTAALLEARCIPLVAKTYINGLTLDLDATRDLDEKLKQDAETAYEKLYTTNPEVADINLGSSQQLQTLLFERWGLPVLKVSDKTGDPSTDKEVLYELAFEDPRAKLVKDLREAKNNRTKFVSAVQKSVKYNGDGCTRPQHRIFSTYTGRMTISSKQKARHVNPRTGKERNIELPTGIALHQWKRGAAFRRQIAVPEGYTLVELDAAGQEFRWMAVASGDETMLSLCAPGEDAHSYMGAQIAQCDYRDLIARHKAEEEEAKQQRYMGKFSNLSFQYRVGSKKATAKARVDYGLDVREPFIKGIQTTYKTTYLGVPIYWRDQIRKCQSLGYVETFAGRRVQLKGPWSGDRSWALESTAINYPIQGTGGDQKYLALAVARNDLPQFGGYFYFELHDGLFFIFPDSVVHKATAFFHDKFANLPYKQAWGVDLPIAFPFDAKLGKSWGDLKDFEG